MATQFQYKLTEEEYLQRERLNETRSEFVDGEMFAMAGGSLRHSLIAANCIRVLGDLLAGKDCVVFSSDARVRTPLTGSYVYPDVSVVCGAVIASPDTSDVLINPILAVAVLSPATRNYDQGVKFSLYREISSLKEYLLVETSSINVKHFSRQPDNSWIFREFSSLEDKIVVPSLDSTLALTGIYNNAMKLPV